MRRIVKTVNVAAAMAALCCMVAVLAGCSSQVYSDMYTYEYPALPRDSVKVVASATASPAAVWSSDR
jgi:hypothetical protein